MDPSALVPLAARAGLQPPASASGAGARLLVAAVQEGTAAVPRTAAEVWAAWVDLGLWQRPRPVPEARDLTELAVADLVEVAELVHGEQDAPPAPARVLSPEEDARLRTLTVLRRLGELAPELHALERELRGKDQRLVVRPPAPVTWPG